MYAPVSGNPPSGDGQTSQENSDENDGWETGAYIPSGDGEEDGSDGTSDDTSASGSEETDGKDNADYGSGGDEEFEKQLGVFDGEILEGRETVLTDNDEAQQGNGAEGNGTGGSQETGNQDIAGTPGSGEGASPGGAVRQSAANANYPAPRSAPAPSAVPPDIPDARDDDVVARQLREAAMAETDPNLREALWNDYRRYKSDS